MTDSTITFELVPGGHAFWYNLVWVLSRASDKSKLLLQLTAIEKSNLDPDPSSDSRRRVLAQLLEDLQHKELNQLDSFELLQRLGVLKQAMERFKDEHIGHHDELARLLVCFESELELHLIKVYTGKKVRDLHFPSRLLTDLNFQAAMQHLKEHDAKMDAVLEEAARMWHELLNLWRELGASETAVSEFGRAVIFVKAAG
jgi:hypothetical protein